MLFSQIQSGLTPLHLAAQEDKVNVAEVLLNHGADVNTQTRVKLSQIIHTHKHTVNTQSLNHLIHINLLCWFCYKSLSLFFYYNALTLVHALAFVRSDLRCYINKGLIPEWIPHSGVKHMHTSTYTCSVTLCQLQSLIHKHTHAP